MQTQRNVRRERLTRGRGPRGGMAARRRRAWWLTAAGWLFVLMAALDLVYAPLAVPFFPLLRLPNMALAIALAAAAAVAGIGVLLVRPWGRVMGAAVVAVNVVGDLGVAGNLVTSLTEGVETPAAVALHVLTAVAVNGFLLAVLARWPASHGDPRE